MALRPRCRVIVLLLTVSSIKRFCFQSLNLWQIHVTLVFLHFVLYFSRNLRIMQGWIDFQVSEFKIRLENTGNACIKRVLCNLRSHKYKCLENSACNLFSPAKCYYVATDLSVVRVVIEGKEKIKSWLMYLLSLPGTGDMQVHVFLLRDLNILELELKSRLLSSLQIPPPSFLLLLIFWFNSCRCQEQLMEVSL